MTAATAKPTNAARGTRCPICRAPSADATRPFCSVRCADIDLGRWVSGGYVIPGGGTDADEDGEAIPDLGNSFVDTPAGK